MGYFDADIEIKPAEVEFGEPSTVTLRAWIYEACPPEYLYAPEYLYPTIQVMYRKLGTTAWKSASEPVKRSRVASKVVYPSGPGGLVIGGSLFAVHLPRYEYTAFIAKEPGKKLEACATYEQRWFVSYYRGLEESVVERISRFFTKAPEPPPCQTTAGQKAADVVGGEFSIPSWVYIADSDYKPPPPQQYDFNIVRKMHHITDLNPTQFKCNPPLQGPYGVASDSYDRIYVADTTSNRVVRMHPNDPNGGNCETLLDDSKVTSPVAIGVTPWGGVYVSGDGGLYSLSSNGDFRGFSNPPNKQLGHVRGIAWHAGYIYVSDYSNHRIVRFQNMDGAGWQELGGPEPGPGMWEFHHPFGISVDSKGRIYVADTMNNRIVRMDDMIGGNWTVYPSPYAPRGIAVDNNFRINVVEYLEVDKDANHKAGYWRIYRIDDIQGNVTVKIRAENGGLNPEDKKWVKPYSIFARC